MVQGLGFWVQGLLTAASDLELKLYGFGISKGVKSAEACFVNRSIGLVAV